MPPQPRYPVRTADAVPGTAVNARADGELLVSWSPWSRHWAAARCRIAGLIVGAAALPLVPLGAAELLVCDRLGDRRERQPAVLTGRPCERVGTGGRVPRSSGRGARAAGRGGASERVLLEEEGLKLFHRFRQTSVRGGGTVTHRVRSVLTDRRVVLATGGPEGKHKFVILMILDYTTAAPPVPETGYAAYLRKFGLQNGYPTYGCSAGDVSVEEHDGETRLRVVVPFPEAGEGWGDRPRCGCRRRRRHSTKRRSAGRRGPTPAPHPRAHDAQTAGARRHRGRRSRSRSRVLRRARTRGTGRGAGRRSLGRPHRRARRRSGGHRDHADA